MFGRLSGNTAPSIPGQTREGSDPWFRRNPGAREHRVQHRLGEPARERVLLAGVEAADQRPLPELRLGPVAEPRPRPRHLRPQLGQRQQRPGPGDTTRARRSPAPDRSSRSSLTRYGRQLSRSSVVGRFCGGGQRFTAVTYAPRSRSPSSPLTEVGWLASPARWIAANSQSPERSPVKIRPVRLPPCAAGASPTTTIPARGSPKPGSGRAQYALPAVAPRRLRRAPLPPLDQAGAPRAGRDLRR